MNTTSPVSPSSSDSGLPPLAAATPPAVPDPLPPFPPARGESARAFAAFCAYLELGPRRRYLAVSRQMGVSLRTVKRWAADFDWRGRIQSHTSRGAGQFVAAAAAAREEEILDAAQREQLLRDRQYAVAEGLLLAAERFLERVDQDDLDQMNFGDACKALDVASRLRRPAEVTNGGEDPTKTRNLSDQLTALLEQAYGNQPPAPDAPVA